MNNHLNILPKRAKFYLKSSKTRCGSLRRSPDPLIVRENPHQELLPKPLDDCIPDICIRNILSVPQPLCPYQFVQYHFVRVSLCPYHFVCIPFCPYHFVIEPRKANGIFTGLILALHLPRPNLFET